MIPLSVSQKNVIMAIFKDDIQLVKKYFMAISFDFDESFKYSVFREFINSAAGMFKEIDLGIYNKQLLGQYQTIQLLDDRFREFQKKSKYALKSYEKDFLSAQDAYREEVKRQEGLKAMLQVMVTTEKNLFSLRESLEKTFLKIPKSDKERLAKLETRLKSVRKEHVDTLHALGEHRRDLDGLEEILKAFEEKHKEEFMAFFKEVTDKLGYQYKASLNYFGYEFNQSLFAASDKSALIKKFKKEANIVGELDLCKYVEYYIRNVNSDMVADVDHRERLQQAKQYCKNQREQGNPI
ncbi:MAG: hypothetical protein U9Q62_09620 [Campylobacterota bacterium]|nr:hypothetical protein [Campylobacterota bacterium]